MKYVKLRSADCYTQPTAYELPSVPNNTAVKHFTQIGAVRNVDWI